MSKVKSCLSKHLCAQFSIHRLLDLPQASTQYGVAEGETTTIQDPDLQELDKSLDGVIAEFISAADFTGKAVSAVTFVVSLLVHMSLLHAKHESQLPPARQMHCCKCTIARCLYRTRKQGTHSITPIVKGILPCWLQNVSSTHQQGLHQRSLSTACTS